MFEVAPSGYLTGDRLNVGGLTGQMAEQNGEPAECQLRGAERFRVADLVVADEV